ncbi:hypothetical protein BDZ45DRAFT_239324 [Acephala macrosclerotiorum]|nr:hypothetical protein BDZ45DRAFT_239324 [Acephala macrosclerotiorum]
MAELCSPVVSALIVSVEAHDIQKTAGETPDSWYRSNAMSKNLKSFATNEVQEAFKEGGLGFFFRSLAKGMIRRSSFNGPRNWGPWRHFPRAQRGIDHLHSTKSYLFRYR